MKTKHNTMKMWELNNFFFTQIYSHKATNRLLKIQAYFIYIFTLLPKLFSWTFIKFTLKFPLYNMNLFRKDFVHYVQSLQKFVLQISVNKFHVKYFKLKRYTDKMKSSSHSFTCENIHKTAKKIMESWNEIFNCYFIFYPECLSENIYITFFETFIFIINLIKTPLTAFS